MSTCFCCLKPFKICLSVCSTGAVIELPNIASSSEIYYLDLEYQGNIHTIERLQTISSKVSFETISGELNESYCYRAYLYVIGLDGTKQIVPYIDANGVIFDCFEICTSLKV